MMTIERRPTVWDLIREMPNNEKSLMLSAPVLLIIWPRNHKRIAAAQRLVSKGLFDEAAVYPFALQYTLTARGKQVCAALKRMGYEVSSC